MDTDLLEHVYNKINVPLIFSGGCSSVDNINYIKNNFPNVSVSIASSLHYNRLNIKELR